MNKFGTVCSVIIMLLAAIAGLFAGVYLNQQPIEGAILFSGYSRICMRYIQRKRTAVIGLLLSVVSDGTTHRSFPTDYKT